MTEKICLITGATDGIGKATALALVARGFKVVVIARNMEKVSAFIREIEVPGTTKKVDYILADLSSMDQVIAMLDTFRQRYDRLDLLINNAGIVMPFAKLTEDGFETTFQVNYLAPFIITNSLLEHLGRSEAGRIINVTSSVYALGKFDLGKIDSITNYSAITAYSTSKLYLLMFTEELAGRVKGLTANSMHPGIVRTKMSTQVQGFPFLFKMISFVAMPFAIAPEQAAVTSLFLATSETVSKVTGKYFVNSKMVKTNSKFDTPVNRGKLWDHSMNIWKAKQH
jgi:retinol dehydrogenase 12